MRLDLGAARDAIDRDVARPLGIETIAAAVGILRVANANIVRGIRVVSVERGHDPRRCVLVPFGGAGPMHGTAVARELGIRAIIVPPTPGILCALGQLLADLRHDLVETQIFPYAPDNAARAASVARRLREAAEAKLVADGISVDRRTVEVRVEARYVGQSYELPVAYAYQDKYGWARVAGDFHAAHRQRFGHADPETPIEIVGFGATAIGRVDTPVLPELRRGERTPPIGAQRGQREIFFESDKLSERGAWFPTKVFDREKLLAGNVIPGPAVIEEVSATTVLYPGDRAEVHANGTLMVECAL